jgi:thiamine biosynthesis lipoprotein
VIHQIEFRAMGCRITAALESPAANAAQKLERLPNWFEEWESCLSRFREDSELSALNRSTGEPVQVSQTLWQVFRVAQEAYRRSGNLVTPAGLNALVWAGYDRSFEVLDDRLPMHLEGAPQPVPDFSRIVWDATSRSISLPPEYQLDFGGIAKGWAAEQAIHRLQLYGPALVDAGGDIAVSGLRTDGKPWPVGVVDPFRPESDLAILRLGRSGAATSGRDYRRWKTGETWQHHIIDPRSGLPAKTDVLSATAVAPTAVEAEFAAKTILILGSRAGLEWIEAQSPFAGLIILGDGSLRFSRRMEAYLWR